MKCLVYLSLKSRKKGDLTSLFVLTQQKVKRRKGEKSSGDKTNEEVTIKRSGHNFSPRSLHSNGNTMETLTGPQGIHVERSLKVQHSAELEGPKLVGWIIDGCSTDGRMYRWLDKWTDR